MKVQNLIIFLLIFMTITVGLPFILAAALPTLYAMLGSFGASLLAGIVLFYILGRTKEASPSS